MVAGSGGKKLTLFSGISVPSSWSRNQYQDNCKALGNISSCFFFYFADEVKHGPWDHLVPMFTNCQIKEATQVGHHVNQLDGRSLNVYKVFNGVSDVYEYL